jgi:catechol 2,3-dioxygenase-like lactoylglutathione lyase family enzyme
MGKGVPRMCMIEISGLHHLRLTVTNLERSKEFDSELIGFEVAAESPGTPEEPAVRNDPAQLYAGSCSSPMACCSGRPAHGTVCTHG